MSETNIKKLKLKKFGFTLIELLAVIVILAIITLIATPTILNILKNAKEESNKRSIDMYGKAVEMAVVNYFMNNGKYPENLSELKIEYEGIGVVCKIMNLTEDKSIYLSECSVDKFEVKDKSTEDGWYHYGKENITAKKAIDVLLSKTNDISVTTYETETDASHEMYTFTHDKTEQTEALTDYRYIGNDPYNYVKFNGDELWRIIGVFTVEDDKGNLEQRIKIIRNESVGTYNWDDKSDRVYTNNWDDSSLNIYLNDTYYHSLSKDAQKMISLTKFYLGGSQEHEHSAKSLYDFERGVEVYDSTRDIYWIGTIGLMYPSDYLYAYAYSVDDICFLNGKNCKSTNAKNGWLYNKLYEWLISPNSRYLNMVYALFSDGHIYGESRANNVSDPDGVGMLKDVRPTLYLSSQVQIIDGDGSESRPYQLKLN